MFVPNEILMCTGKAGFHNVLSAIYLQKKCYCWSQSRTATSEYGLTPTYIKLPGLLLFASNFDFNHQLKRWNNIHGSWHSSCRVFYGSSSFFGWDGCLFPAHLGASWATDSKETMQEIAWISLLFWAVCLVMWGFHYLRHSRAALLWGLCWC